MSKLRVALVFSGQPRCIDGLAYDSFQRCILSRYDVDVYAHFWGELESQKSTGCVVDNIEKFKQLYAPKAIRVDDPLRASDYPLEFVQRASRVPVTRDTILTIPPSNNSSLLRNCISMYESMHRAYELCSASGVTYDWVIRTRSDCVLLRCPELDRLDPSYLYAPQWHPVDQAVLVNIALIFPPSLAPDVFAIRKTIEQLPGVTDEWFVFNHLARCNRIPLVRTLPRTILYPTLTRNGLVTDHPEPSLASTVVHPPYPMYAWASNCWRLTTETQPHT